MAWHADFYQQQPYFASIARPAAYFKGFIPHWPELDDFNHCLAAQNIPLRCINGDKPSQLPYEHQILHYGELPTRRHSWHDYLNLLVWMNFPQTKKLLNSLQCQQDRVKIDPKQRTPLQNQMALFDECGMIIIADREDYLDQIRQFDWKTLFWQNRYHIMQHMRFFIFGHGLLEKGLQPYTGITGMSLLFLVKRELVTTTGYTQIAEVDRIAANYFSQLSKQTQLTKLSPCPLLGVPGWCKENESESYYENTAYFRSGRRKSNQS